MGTRQTEPLDLIKYAGPTLSGLRPVSHRNRHSSRELSAHDFKCLLGSVLCSMYVCFVVWSQLGAVALKPYGM